MESETEPDWLTAIRELAAIAQTGLAFASDAFDRERYSRVQSIAAGLLATPMESTSDQILPFLASEKGYATPKVGVRGAVFESDRILMVREANDGKWSLPGGWCDINQTAAECTEREIQEESGLIARAVRLARVYDHRLHNYPPHAYHHYLLFFICEKLGGEMMASDETDAVDWFAEDQLPEMSTSRVTRAQVLDMFRHYRDPALATEFDTSITPLST